jgi:hypothetical protein
MVCSIVPVLVRAGLLDTERMDQVYLIINIPQTTYPVILATKDFPDMLVSTFDIACAHRERV